MKNFLKKHKSLLISITIIFIVIILAFAVLPAVIHSSAPKTEWTVVIDAGHGARDGGCVGVNGSIEKDLNLEYAKTLKSLLETRNIKVVMTRTNDDELYNNNASNKKLSEMKARANLINKTAPDLVVSIHMNSFALSSVTGAKAFYRANDEASKQIANNIQKSMFYYCNLKSKAASLGDYYILNCTNYSSVLIECGYLSNAEEEAKLNTKDYREKLMHSVFCGIIISLGSNYY